MGNGFWFDEYVVNEKGKHIITPFGRLKRRVNKEIVNKKLIGDIVISSEEEEMLFFYIVYRYNTLKSRGSHSMGPDPLFVLALIRFGMKFYDRNFWSHIKVLVGGDFPVNHQTWIGTTCTDTLRHYNKIIVNESEHVKNILLHGFISDYYASDLFSFLFKFYSINLERDISRLDKDYMTHLIDAIIKNDNTERTYLIKQQVSDAVKDNVRGAKTRIRGILNAIHQMFWYGCEEFHTANRIKLLLKSWMSGSLDVKEERKKYDGLNESISKRKNYFEPYLMHDNKTNSFALILPKQILANTQNDNDAFGVKWFIQFVSSSGEKEIKQIPPAILQTPIGYQTEKEMLLIDKKYIFDTMNIVLSKYGEKVKSFKIASADIRFFDEKNNAKCEMLSFKSLHKGSVYSFSKIGYDIKSEAIIDSIIDDGYVQNYYEFEHGDILILPNGKLLSVGNTIKEGLQSRSKVKGTVAIKEDVVHVYRSLPMLIVEIPESKEAGTLLTINESRHRLFDGNYKIEKVKLDNDVNFPGYIIDLSVFNIKNNGIYEVIIDVPNDRTVRTYKFAYIKDLSYEFEEAPYIFKNRGTLVSNINLGKSLDGAIKEKNENIYNFDINSEKELLSFRYKAAEESFILNIEIPMLLWKFDDGEWNTEKPTEIWRDEFPSFIYFKTTENKLRLLMKKSSGDIDDSEEDSNDIDIDGNKFIDYAKVKSKNLIEADLTRFKNYVNKDVGKLTFSVQLSNEQVQFFDVITQTKVNSINIRGDFKNNILIGEFEIIGKASYCVDITYGQEKIAEKLPLIERKFELTTKLKNGEYIVTLFEEESDNFGFGEYEYNELATFYNKILNPKNLAGVNLFVRYVQENVESRFRKEISEYWSYKICYLRKCGDGFKYSGVMRVSHAGLNKEKYRVTVKFFDEEKMQHAYIRFISNDEYQEEECFLYDSKLNKILREEDHTLSTSERYRRYQDLINNDNDDYVFTVSYEIDEKKIKHVARNDNQSIIVDEVISGKPIDNQTIEKKEEVLFEVIKDPLDENLNKSTLTPLTFNRLASSKIKTYRDLLNFVEIKGTKALQNILNKDMVKEVLAMLNNMK